MGERVSEIHIGAQGWNYKDWVGNFYPRGTKAADYLDLYLKAFDTVEVDSTFYAIPPENSIKSWKGRAAAGFTYSLKLPQAITHQARLVNCRETLDRFCERARGLQEKLGAVLIQLPPDLSPRVLPHLEKFLSWLPQGIRFAVEFRDQAWLAGDVGETVLALFAAHRVALALVDGPWLPREAVWGLVGNPLLGAAEFAYVRWMGPRTLTDFSRVQIDHSIELAEWAEGFKRLRQRVPLLYGYFSNFYEGHSPASCNQFKRLVGLPVVEPEDLVMQPSLF
jgi:uncharacterized protein YecE (DUF72 family)